MAIWLQHKDSSPAPVPPAHGLQPNWLKQAHGAEPKTTCHLLRPELKAGIQAKGSCSWWSHLPRGYMQDVFRGSLLLLTYKRHHQKLSKTCNLVDTKSLCQALQASKMPETFYFLIIRWLSRCNRVLHYYSINCIMLSHYELYKIPEQNLTPGRSQHPLPKANISLAPLVVLVLGVKVSSQDSCTICWEGIRTQSSPCQLDTSNDRDLVVSFPPGSIKLSFLHGFTNPYKDYTAQHNNNNK